MKLSRISIWCAAWLVALPLSTNAGSPAARVGDSGQPGLHAGSVIAAGSPNVFINGLAAARQGDPTTCPQICLIPFPIPHSPGSVSLGSATVFINSLAAVRIGDTIIEPGTPAACQPMHSVTSGSLSVQIGP